MAITVNGRILRNLPEQVSKNTEDIIDLQDVSNNYGIRITALEGDAIALATFQDCTFTGTTSFQGPLISNDGFTFDGNGSVGGDLSVGGSFAVTGSSTFTGDVTETGNENVGGNLAVTGNITGGSIIENMSGYSMTTGSVPENCVFEKLFYGAVKNGNKLTLVFAFNFTKQTGATAGSFEIGEIIIPASVGVKLYPARIGEYDYLDAKEINCFSTVFGSPIKARCYLQKINSFTLNGRIFLNEFVADTKYYCRYEVTFLLSDSL